MPLLVGLYMQKDRGGGWGGALDQTYKCLNKQLGRFFFLLPPLSEAPLRDYNHLVVRPARPLPQTS